MSRPDPYFPGHGDRSYSAEHYELELACRIDGNRLDGRATIAATALVDLRRLELDLGDFAVTRVAVDGRKPRRFRHRDGKLVVELAGVVPAGTGFTVVVGYRGTPRPMPGVLGDAGWEELTDGVIVAAQPYGAPSWFPCNDRPDDKAGYRFTVTAPTGYHVVANGTLVESRRSASGVTWVYAADEPMAPYLATVSIGRYAVQQLPAAVPMQVVVPGGRQVTLPESFRRQPEMLTAFTELFGPYPFGSYTVVVTEDDLEIPLESQTVSVFGLNYLDDDWGSERLVAHELAHQWFGNAVTVPGWDDIWLHEGFACYAEWLWSERSGRESADEHARAHHARLSGLPQDLVLGDPGAADMFDDRVYKRGALLLHALRLTVGDDALWRLLAQWVERYRFGTAGTPEFVALAEEIAGRPLRELFTAWLEETALPDLPAAG
ncbi:M1 family metallopeptidase [Marmoricola sp. RAF53]|uniref:M1 family metallopeptidase n=1 Tax=Marmoricola sp. RAF53 TaxID=3233059 RepID=UPI003F9E1BFF